MSKITRMKSNCTNYMNFYEPAWTKGQANTNLKIYYKS